MIRLADGLRPRIEEHAALTGSRPGPGTPGLDRLAPPGLPSAPACWRSSWAPLVAPVGGRRQPPPDGAGRCPDGHRRSPRRCWACTRRFHGRAAPSAQGPAPGLARPHQALRQVRNHEWPACGFASEVGHPPTCTRLRPSLKQRPSRMSTVHLLDEIGDSVEANEGRRVGRRLSTNVQTRSQHRGQPRGRSAQFNRDRGRKGVAKTPPPLPPPRAPSLRRATGGDTDADARRGRHLGQRSEQPDQSSANVPVTAATAADRSGVTPDGRSRTGAQPAANVGLHAAIITPPAHLVRLGRYQIIDRIATGGMAEVYLAVHGELAGFRTPVVLKKVLPHLASNPAVHRHVPRRGAHRLAAGSPERGPHLRGGPLGHRIFPGDGAGAGQVRCRRCCAGPTTAEQAALEPRLAALHRRPGRGRACTTRTT